MIGPKWPDFSDFLIALCQKVSFHYPSMSGIENMHWYIISSLLLILIILVAYKTISGGIDYLFPIIL